MHERREFEATLIELGGGWVGCIVPFSVEEVFGKRGYAKIKGRIDGFEIEKTLMPSGKGSHFLVVSKAIQKEIKKELGDMVLVSFELNEARIEADEMGIDFEDALENAPGTKAVWLQKTASRRLEILRWINETQSAEARTRRIDKAINDFLRPPEI